MFTSRRLKATNKAHSVEKGQERIAFDAIVCQLYSVSLETLCILLVILGLLYVAFFFWIVLKYRGQEEEKMNSVGVLEPNDLGDH